MVYKFSEKSERLLNTVRKELNFLAHEVIKISPIDFCITEGYRSEIRQQELYKQGKTKTLNSKHSQCMAIDICPYVNGKADFNAVNDMYIIVGLFIAKAKELNIDIRTGALWEHNSTIKNDFVDAWHVEVK